MEGISITRIQYIVYDPVHPATWDITKNLSSTVETRKLKWYGHTTRSNGLFKINELCINMVFLQIISQSFHPSQPWPSSGSLSSHHHCCYRLSDIHFVSTRHMTTHMMRVFVTCGDWRLYWTFHLCSAFPSFAIIISITSSYWWFASFGALRCIVPNAHCHIPRLVWWLFCTVTYSA